MPDCKATVKPDRSFLPLHDQYTDLENSVEQKVKTDQYACISKFLMYVSMKNI